MKKKIYKLKILESVLNWLKAYLLYTSNVLLLYMKLCP